MKHTDMIQYAQALWHHRMTINERLEFMRRTPRKGNETERAYYHRLLETVINKHREELLEIKAAAFAAATGAQPGEWLTLETD